ncbi:hypothetical protein GGI23_004625, partial [Coemansia sp. RSA 2559]
MNRLDHNRHSMVIKLILGLAPTMEHQRKWYPEVYLEAEMLKCPRGCGQVEMQAHMLTCRFGAQDDQTDNREIKTRWTEELLRV